MNAIGNFKFIIPDKGKSKEFLNKHSFDITRDLKKCKLNEKELRDLIIEDAVDDSTNLKGNLLFGSHEIGIRKIRLSKGNNKGKRSGYRLIALVAMVNSSAILIHLYDKKNKHDVSKNEKEELKKVLKAFTKN